LSRRKLPLRAAAELVINERIGDLRADAADADNGRMLPP
jgi:hypothetical protein